ncbi:MAG: cytidylate kinase family protein [Candidatus Anstonellales archaeon]
MKVAISGLAGSGKTVFAKALHSAIKDRGLDVKLMVPSFKDIAAQLKMSLAEYESIAQKDFRVDRLFDEKIREQFSKEQNVIMASWLAIWNVEADLKIFLHAPLEVRANRIAKRDSIPIESAKAYVLDRDYRNRARYMAVYGIDIYNAADIVDAVLNSARLTLDGEVKAALGLLSSKGLI